MKIRIEDLVNDMLYNGYEYIAKEVKFNIFNDDIIELTFIKHNSKKIIWGKYINSEFMEVF